MQTRLGHGRRQALHPVVKLQKRTLGYAACALAGGLWSTGFLFGKIALRF